MAEMFEESLCQIGFTDNESLVYLELLKLGPQPVSVVAKRTRLNRTTTYSILKTLEGKAVVSSYISGSLKYFMANDPNSLVGYLDRKCRTFDYYRNRLLSMVPKFRGLCDSVNFSKPAVTFFEGLEGVKTVMHDALTAVDEFRAYVCLDQWIESDLRDFLLEYKDFRIFDRRVGLRAIVPDTSLVKNFFESNYVKDCSFMKILYIPPEGNETFFENEVNIYGDKVAIIHLEKGNEYGVVIEDSQIAAMHKRMFDIMWRNYDK